MVTNRALAVLALCGLMMGVVRTGAASRLIFDPQANARRDIDSAIAKASRTGRNIVLIFGANW